MTSRYGQAAGVLACVALFLATSACTGRAALPATSPPVTAEPGATPPGAAQTSAIPKRSLASFAKSNASQECYNRATEPYTAVVDAHFHPRPFGGQAIRPAQLFEFFDKTGVRFVNYFGIGQFLDLRSGCTYYLDCPGTSALPSIKNDVVNGQEVKAYPHDNVNIVLSMTFMDLQNPQGIVDIIALYDREFPGMFKWAGELNVVKQALFSNKHEPATIENIDAWAPFMKVLRERGIPVTFHSDLGDDANPTKYVYLMKHILKTYPDNKIVWAHMGLSKELQRMDPAKHVQIMREALASSDNLMLDISWDVLFNAYHEFGPVFVALINEYPDRFLPGSDFVAAGNKPFEQYQKEQEVTSRVNKSLNDEAFRKVALGENYFRLLNLGYTAPPVCQ